jgi:hypothetical protein
VLGHGAYSAKARLVPALLVVLPVAIGVGVWLKQDVLSWGVGGGLTIGGVLLLVATERVRRLGRAVEDRIHQTLGAKPTTIMLRHRDTRLDRTTKQRYHQCLRAKVPGFRLPSAQDEHADPKAADEQFDSCTRWLLENTRTRSNFPLVFAELCSYGLVRNLRGMRPAAVATAITGIAACALRIREGWADGVHAASLVGLIVSAGMLAVWSLHLNDKWVEAASFDYAKALLASCDSPHLQEKKSA